MFNIGDFVFDTATGANVQVMERIELVNANIKVSHLAEKRS